jgi:hypothetical protein
MDEASRYHPSAAQQTSGAGATDAWLTELAELTELRVWRHPTSGQDDDLETRPTVWTTAKLIVIDTISAVFDTALDDTLDWFHAHVEAVVRSVGAPVRLWLPPLAAAGATPPLPHTRSTSCGRWDGTHSGARHIAPDIP